MSLLKRLRKGLASTIFAFLFVFYVPMIPINNASVCWGCNIMMSYSRYYAYDSLGFVLFRWGLWVTTASRFISPPVIVVGGVFPELGQLTYLASLIFLLLTIFSVALLLVSPEIVHAIGNFASKQTPGNKRLISQAEQTTENT